MNEILIIEKKDLNGPFEKFDKNNPQSENKGMKLFKALGGI